MENQEVVEMLKEMQIKAAKCTGFFCRARDTSMGYQGFAWKEN